MATRPFTASRALANGFDWLLAELASWSPRATVRDVWRFLAPPGLTPIQRLWRLFWLPFWVWSDLPAPVLRSYPSLTSDGSDSGNRLLAVLRGLARRFTALMAVGVLFRAITLSAVVGGVWAIVDMAGGTQVDSRRLIIGAILIAIAGAVLTVTSRPRPHDIARMLDRSFALNDRVATGLEGVVAGASPSQSRRIGRLQIVDATNTAVALAPRLSIRILMPVREAVLATSCLLLMAALLLMRGTGDGLPSLRDAAVPSFVTAQDRVAQLGNTPPNDEVLAEAPSVEEVQERADSSAAAQQDLLALADALDDNPLTKPVADEIRAGNYDRAAAELANVAAELDTLSPEAQEDLANDLDVAADRMSGENPELQEKVEETADSLRTGEDSTEAATDLSEEVRQTGEKIVPQEELASDMREARTTDPGADEGRTGDSQPEAGDESEPGGGQPSEGAPENGQDASGGQSSDDESSSDQTSDGSGQESDRGGQEGSDSESSTGSPGDQPGPEGGEAMGGTEGGTTDSSTGEGGATQPGEGEVQGGEPLPQQGPSGGSNDNAQEGSGAGSGGDNDDEQRQTSNSAESRPGTGSDGEPDPNVIESDAETSTSDGTEIDPATSITLSRSPDETGYQAGGASSSSSSGSGSGAAAGTGSTEQGEVGVAGPDANRVPDEYRSTVEEYFSGDP